MVSATFRAIPGTPVFLLPRDMFIYTEDRRILWLMSGRDLLSSGDILGTDTSIWLL